MSTHLLFLALTTFGALGAVTNCISPPSGLVAWWPGDGNGTELVNGNHGSLMNGVAFSAGRVGQEFSFDGIDDRIQIPDVEALKLTNSLTIESWIFLPSYPVETNNYGLSFIAFRGDNQDALDPYYLGIEWQGRAWFHIASLTAVADLFAPVPTNRFFHLAATLDHATGSMRLYVDGILAAQTTTTVRPFRNLNPNLNPAFAIGNHPQPSFYNFPFKGQIDELAIYNRALTATELGSIMTAGAKGKCKPAPAIRINGQVVQGSTITVENSAFVEISSSFGNGSIRYTLNGSSPASGTTYTGPFNVFQSVVLRAMAYDLGQVQSVESPALTINVVHLPQLSVSVDGVNPATATMTASISSLEATSPLEADIAIYDGDNFLFGRPIINQTSYSMNFTWADVPLGSHCLRAVVTDRIGSGDVRVRESSSPFCFSVVGQPIGFSGVDILKTIPSPPNANDGTTVECLLRIQNLSSAPSNPLRVRLYRSQTYFAMDSPGSPINPVPSFSEPFFSFVTTNAALVPGNPWTVTVPLSSSIFCPPIGFGTGNDRWQYHIFAALEELVGTKWTFIDRTKVFSSIMEKWFPYNDGVVGTDPVVNPLVNTNLFTFLTSLSILGNTNIQEGSVVAFVALASLNDGSTGSVNAAWQSAPLPISPNGIVTAPYVQNNVTVDLNATFTRRTTRNATRRVTIVNVGDPVTFTTHPSNQVAAIGGNVTWTVVAGGSPPPTYQWRKNGTNLAGATSPTLTLVNVQSTSVGAYSVLVSNLLGAVSSSTGSLVLVSRPLFTGPTRNANGTFRFGLQGSPGSLCWIETSTNLPQWTFLTNITLGASPVMLTNAMVGPRRFFRARINASP